VTGKWDRSSTNSATNLVAEATVIFDPVTNRFYYVPTEVSDRQALQYLDPADWTFKSSPSYAWPTGGGSGYGSAVYIETGGLRLIVHFQGSLWQALDLDNISAGWTVLSHSGTALGNTANAPVWHPEQGVLYWRAASSAGQGLVRITPPGSSPLSNAWVGSTVSLTGDTVPEFQGASVGLQHYRSLCYIPTLEMLGWVTAFGVALLNP